MKGTETSCEGKLMGAVREVLKYLIFENVQTLQIGQERMRPVTGERCPNIRRERCGIQPWRIDVARLLADLLNIMCVFSPAFKI